MQIDARIGVATTRIFHQVLQCILQAKAVQCEWAKLAHQLVYFLVYRVGTFNHHACGVFGMGVDSFGTQYHGLPQAFDGRDLLTQFIVQFSGDLATHFFNAGLNDLGEFAVLRQCQGGFTRLGLRSYAVLYRLGHGIEGFSHDLGFFAGHGRQSGAVTAALHGL